MKRHIYASSISLLLIFSILPAISLSLTNPAVAQGYRGAVTSVDRDATAVGQPYSDCASGTVADRISKPAPAKPIPNITPDIIAASPPQRIRFVLDMQLSS
jgi:hypothetical protein